MGHQPNKNWGIANNEQSITKHQPLRTRHKWI